jgi:maltose/moltooligosaccharide transporter
MFQLAIVQFFTWMALFCIWTYGLNGVAENIFGVGRVLVDGNMVVDTGDPNFNEARNWWGIANAVMAAFALGFSFVWPALANKFGRKAVYSFGLMMGAFGLASIFFIQDKYMLLLSMAGWGIATAVINAIPFAIVCARVPAQKMGVYMGVFNLSIVIPQIVFSIGGGLLFKLAVGDAGSNVMMMVVAGVLFMLAAMSVVFVKDNKEVATPAL